MMMAARAPPTFEQIAATKDIMRMIYACVKFIGVPNPQTHRTEFNDDPLIKILKADNIKSRKKGYYRYLDDLKSRIR